ncbi:MAG: hypothetical protein JAZ15_11890 [Candidatus Thiodiazotropha endolucinida]|nr:hypothetical protein [Candidatus Thiodiazotropha taylori]MCW4313723.1 hypothetical protein [Candidatus Thiodiazotropha taylori]
MLLIFLVKTAIQATPQTPFARGVIQAIKSLITKHFLAVKHRISAPIRELAKTRIPQPNFDSAAIRTQIPPQNPRQDAHRAALSNDRRNDKQTYQFALNAAHRASHAARLIAPLATLIAALATTHIAHANPALAVLPIAKAHPTQAKPGTPKTNTAPTHNIPALPDSPSATDGDFRTDPTIQAMMKPEDNNPVSTPPTNNTTTHDRTHTENLTDMCTKTYGLPTYQAPPTLSAHLLHQAIEARINQNPNTATQYAFDKATYTLNKPIPCIPLADVVLPRQLHKHVNSFIFDLYMTVLTTTRNPALTNNFFSAIDLYTNEDFQHKTNQRNFLVAAVQWSMDFLKNDPDNMSQILNFLSLLSGYQYFDDLYAEDGSFNLAHISTLDPNKSKIFNVTLGSERPQEGAKADAAMTTLKKLLPHFCANKSTLDIVNTQMPPLLRAGVLTYCQSRSNL